MSEMKTPREIMIKHWIVRMKEVHGVDVTEEDFKKEEPGWKFMLKAIEDYHLQFRVSDEEIEEMFPTDKYYDTIYNGGRIDGAKWMRDKIFK